MQLHRMKGRRHVRSWSYGEMFGSQTEKCFWIIMHSDIKWLHHLKASGSTSMPHYQFIMLLKIKNTTHIQRVGTKQFCRATYCAYLTDINCFHVNHAYLEARFVISWTTQHLPCRLQYLEGAHQCLIYTHHGTSVIEFSTVVRGWEYCYELAVSEKLISIFNNLHSNNAKA